MEPVTTPYDAPRTLWERITYPSLAGAYLRGVDDSDSLGRTAMQMGLTEESMMRYTRFSLKMGYALRPGERNMTMHVLHAIHELEDKDGNYIG